MANRQVVHSLIAKEAVRILDNELVMAKKVFRGYEEEFGKSINGFEPGDTISIKRPTDFTVRDGAVMSVQDASEGKFTLSVDKQKGIDFQFTSKELTLNIKKLSERVIKPAMVQLANQVDADLMALYNKVPSWVGTPGQTINSFTDFAKGPERMDEYANPTDMRCATLSPADHWGMIGSQTSLLQNQLVGSAYTKGSLGNVGGVETYMSQNVPTHTVGVATGSPLINGAAQETTWALSQDTGTQTLNTDGWTNSTTGILKAGDIITIAGVNAVNPVTKADLGFLRQFVVTADADSGATTGPAALTISPPIITTGAQKTVSVAGDTVADGLAITVLGTGGTGYRQNMVFCKNAFALVSVPMVYPPGSVDVTRETYKGTSVRLIPVYDGTNDISKYRLDILYGVKAVDVRLAHRLSGTA